MNFHAFEKFEAILATLSKGLLTQKLKQLEVFMSVDLSVSQTCQSVS